MSFAAAAELRGPSEEDRAPPQGRGPQLEGAPPLDRGPLRQAATRLLQRRDTSAAAEENNYLLQAPYLTQGPQDILYVHLKRAP